MHTWIGRVSLHSSLAVQVLFFLPSHISPVSLIFIWGPCHHIYLLSSNWGDNIFLKIHFRMPPLWLRDLPQFRHFFRLSIRSKQLQLIIYSGISEGRGLKLNWILSNCLNISWIARTFSCGIAHFNFNLLFQRRNTFGFFIQYFDCWECASLIIYYFIK